MMWSTSCKTNRLIPYLQNHHAGRAHADASQFDVVCATVIIVRPDKNDFTSPDHATHKYPFLLTRTMFNQKLQSTLSVDNVGPGYDFCWTNTLGLSWCLNMPSSRQAISNCNDDSCFNIAATQLGEPSLEVANSCIGCELATRRFVVSLDRDRNVHFLKKISRTQHFVLFYVFTVGINIKRVISWYNIVRTQPGFQWIKYVHLSKPKLTRCNTTHYVPKRAR